MQASRLAALITGIRSKEKPARFHRETTVCAPEGMRFEADPVDEEGPALNSRLLSKLP